MRLFEIEQPVNEAIMPEDDIHAYTFIDEKHNVLDDFTVIGGRIIDSVSNRDKMNSLNLKNVRAPNIKTKALVNEKPVVAFHGTYSDFTQFKGDVWLATDIQLAMFHSSFMGAAHGPKNKFIYVVTIQSDDLYVMGTEAKNGEILNITSESPGGEDLDIIESIFDIGYDTIQWKDSFDLPVGVTGKLYYTNQPHRIKILKRFSVIDHQIIDADIYKDTMNKYNRPISKLGAQFIQDMIPKLKLKRERDKLLSMTVIDPGLTSFSFNAHITDAEYEENKEFGLTAEPGLK